MVEVGKAIRNDLGKELSDPRTVFAWSSERQRCIDSGQHLLKGLFPSNQQKFFINHRKRDEDGVSTHLNIHTECIIS